MSLPATDWTDDKWTGISSAVTAVMCILQQKGLSHQLEYGSKFGFMGIETDEQYKVNLAKLFIWNE